MDSSSGFGSTPGDKRAIHTRFRCGSGCHCLNRPPRVTRRIILQKARRQPVLADLGLRLHVSRRFQGLFHSPRRGAFHRSLTVLCAIGRCVYVALGSGLPSFTPDCSCPVLLKYHSWASMRVSYPAVTVFGDAFQTSSDTHLMHQWTAAAAREWTYNPERATPAGLTHARFRLLPVRSPLLREYFLFLGVHEMFQFPRCPPGQWPGHRFTTMGLPHSEIVGSMPARGSPTLIAAMPRPSSARSAEASTLCSYCLPSRKT
jgi:hypothetical protein